MKTSPLYAIALLSLLTTRGESSFSGYVELESRSFLESPAFHGQEDGSQLSVAAEPEFRFNSGQGNVEFTLIPFARWDAWDQERSHVDLREAFVRYSADAWELLIGANRVFWGVTESRHLVDVINQTDAVESTDNEDKLGQPMVMLGTFQDWGSLQFYVLPYFRERSFSDTGGRLRGPLPVSDDAEYESNEEEWNPDLALRYSHYLGDWDLGWHLFHGTSREPDLLPNEDGSELTPRYRQITQTGIDLQYTRNAWLWKLESILREGHGDRFFAAVGGVEYTRYQLFDSAADLGLLAEYHVDERDSRAPATIFDDDLFAGLRLALNDTQDTQMLLGLIQDTHHHSRFWFAEAERRFGDFWLVELEARLFADLSPEDPGVIYDRDDFVSLSLQRHF